MISHKHKFIFIHIPGTGGTSIEHALESYQEGKLTTQGGGEWHPTLEDWQTIFRGYRLETHPHECANAKHLTARDWQAMLGNKYNDYWKFTIVRNPIEKAKSMIRFLQVHNLPDKSVKSSGKWFYDQIYYVADTAGNIIVDDIYKFENLAGAWKSICKKLNIKHTTLEHKNPRSKEFKQEIKFNDDMLEELKTKLKADFELFDYELDKG